MKTLFLLPAFLCATLSFAQEQQQSTGIKTENQALSKEPLSNETIGHCDAMIKAIDTKVAHVQADKAMREKAQANGWFDRMAANRERYVVTKKSLEEKNTTR